MEYTMHEDFEVARKVHDIIPASIVILNNNSEIIYANKKAEEILGISKGPGQPTYNSPRFIITTENDESLNNETVLISELIDINDEVDGKKLTIKLPNGSFRVISLNTVPLNSGKENLVAGAIGTVEDITELKEAQENLIEARNTYKDLFMNLIDEVHMWKLIRDDEGKIQSWRLIDVNPPALRSWNKSRRAVIGKTAHEIFGLATINQFMPIVETIFETGEPYLWEEYFEPTDQYLSMASIPLNDSFISTGKDITEKKLSEKLLIDAKAEAEEANRLKTKFLNNMSHEIRTPMNGIIGFTDLLESSETTQDEMKHYASIIRSSSHQLLRTIEDILEISSLESLNEPTNESAFNLNELLRELISVFDLKSEKRNIPIHLKKDLEDCQSEIISDRSKLYRIIINLIENALKFTHEGFIEIGYHVKGSELNLYVKDTGIGISEESKEIIFERFTQENTKLARSAYGGLGLGLSISKKCAKLLGGDISVESEKGVGSTFFLSMPYKKAGEEEEEEEEFQSEKETSSEVKSATILIAEDEEVNFAVLEAILKRRSNWKYNIIHAWNGQEALEKCRSYTDIDLILMDIRMPIMDGHEATRQIKSEYPDIPVIAQTAYSTKADEEKAMNNGCDAIMIKPINKAELFDLMDRLIKVDS